MREPGGETCRARCVSGARVVPASNLSLWVKSERTRNSLCQICATSSRMIAVRSARYCDKMHGKFRRDLWFLGPSDISVGGTLLPNEEHLSGRVVR